MAHHGPLNLHIHPAAGTVGDLAMRRPHAVKVLQRHGIDFCCGGGKALDEACAAVGVGVQTLLDEVTAVENRGQGGQRWDTAPLPALIDHILATHHEGLAEELDRIVAMAERVLTVHGPKDFERLSNLYEVTVQLRADLLPHLAAEETTLFPAVRAANRAAAQAAIAGMVAEHEAVGALLARASELTGHYTVPEGACATWRALWHGLQELDADLRQHIHLENNVLFARLRAEA
ncbi:MAG: iron-sulfur cluster repair di-iron protein [Deltaproteobacteria bacterium]|nr:iron-sulfur cluster repair di-iron protein [Deltaproteobacteria bacterium]